MLLKIKLLLFIVTVFFENTYASVNEDTIPTLEKGADIFVTRCALCHGDMGMGEGQLPLAIKDYPNTNLITNKKSISKDDIHNVIAYGSLIEGVSEFMPPMGNELTWTEITSVSMFVYELKNNTDKAVQLLQDKKPIKYSKVIGKKLYEQRCVLCHGKHGYGDGRMSKVITSPPPFNLTKSRVPEAYLKKIISLGGEKLGRSPQMPPWEDQFSEREINQIVAYIISLRK